METANIQQALAIYRLSDALIPTAVVGKVISHSLADIELNTSNQY
jgi:hypothetical protein